jgi:hypothetical protein
MQFRDRDVANLAIGAVCAAIIALIGVAVFGLWHEKEGIWLPLIGTVAGVLGFVCAILAEYIHRWKGLTMAVISVVFFYMWLNFGNAEGFMRAFVIAALVVSGMIAVACSVPQLIVNLQPAVSRAVTRIRTAKPTGRTSS